MTIHRLGVTALRLMTFCKADGTAKAASPEIELLLPEFSSRETLSVQLETVRLNGVTAMRMDENLVSVISTLTNKVTQVRSDNEELRSSYWYIWATGPNDHQGITEGGLLPPQSVTSQRHAIKKSAYASKTRRQQYQQCRQLRVNNGCQQRFCHQCCAT